MPRAFADDERERIRGDLMTSGLRQFERMGVRAARIEDICREVGIAKGSFYAFFPSKEELFMTFVEEHEAQHMSAMLVFIAEMKGSAHDRMGGFFDMMLKRIETDPLLNLIMSTGEIPYLVRKLGPERFLAGQEKDRRFAEQAAAQWAEAGLLVNPDDLLNLMTITLSVATAGRQMPGGQYGPAVGLLRDLFVARLVGRAT